MSEDGDGDNIGGETPRYRGGLSPLALAFDMGRNDYISGYEHRGHTFAYEPEARSYSTGWDLEHADCMGVAIEVIRGGR